MLEPHTNWVGAQPKGSIVLDLSWLCTTKQGMTSVNIQLVGRGVTFLVFVLQLIIFSLAILWAGKMEAILLSMRVTG